MKDAEKMIYFHLVIVSFKKLASREGGGELIPLSFIFILKKSKKGEKLFF